MKFYKCYSLKLAKYLCEKGFKIVDTIDDKRFLGERFIFLFDDTPELRSAVIERSK